ncbi:unnamed protein product [Dovyalis caffra]|uniref:non-specific serine/threonine protein kinase n=1 Tax=Dovyalis caffra TaxID=77055 RepID=A0AAV1SIP9_9ROSI|nr:unnamed protein product [Dovyalis caffra]
MFLLTGVALTTITISNKCNFTVWPAISSMPYGSDLSTTSFSLEKEESKNIATPDNWSGRVWGRTNCTQDDTGRFSCFTGDCGSGKIRCPKGYGSSPMTLAEFQLDYSAALDLFYVSFLDGYNLPLLVESSDQSCSSAGCAVDLNSLCPSSELMVNRSDGKIAGCRSPCTAYGLSQYCCNDTHSTPDTCKPSSYSQTFKKSCPKAFSYPLDAETSGFTCASMNYHITFCPGNTTNSSETTESLVPSPGEVTPSHIPSPQEIIPNPLPEIRPNTTPRRSASIIAGVTGSGLLIISFVVILILKAKWCWKSENVEQDVEYDQIKQVPGMPVRFSYEELCVATDDFKEMLGRGGFGSVFKGKLADGTEIAVKRLEKLGQGMSEFLAEAETIGSLHHFNLVRLIGFCAEKSFRLLVFEYLTNGSLDNWIFMNVQRSLLDWQTRKKIILDIAKGLAYLHEDCRHTTVHLDVKPQNILLDSNFHAKMADFGLSKLIDRDISRAQITMRGTPGYIAPELCISSGCVTVKVDIYSFGIVLLQIVCSRRNVDESLPESAFHLLTTLQKKADEDRVRDMVETSDEYTQSDRDEILRMIHVAAWCLQDDPERRPLMSTVLKVLEGVMEVDSNINYQFSHALISSSVGSNHICSAPPLASVLSHPR